MKKLISKYQYGGTVDLGLDKLLKLPNTEGSSTKKKEDGSYNPNDFTQESNAMFNLNEDMRTPAVNYMTGQMVRPPINPAPLIAMYGGTEKNNAQKMQDGGETQRRFGDKGVYDATGKKTLMTGYPPLAGVLKHAGKIPSLWKMIKEDPVNILDIGKQMTKNARTLISRTFRRNPAFDGEPSVIEKEVVRHIVGKDGSHIARTVNEMYSVTDKQ